MITEKANIAEANPTMQHAQPNLSFLEGKNLFIYNCYFYDYRNK